MRDNFDRFYTQDTVAQKCIDTLNTVVDNYDVIVEPSAGSGAFSNKIDDCIAFDISPTHDTVIEKDWLTTQKEDFPNYENMVIVGNPPFGKRSVLAKKFITHSIKELNATTIAFILPQTFSKRTNQNVFPPEWRLVEEVELSKEESVFELYEEGGIFIPCTYYIWTRSHRIKPGVDLRKKQVSVPDEIIFMPRGSTESDFALNGNNGKVKELSSVTNPKAEHYIKINDAYDRNAVIEFMKKLDYTFHSSVNGGVAWINKEDISHAFTQAKETQNKDFRKQSRL